MTALLLTLAVTATADRTDIRLSESATVTLSVEGDTPLRVTPPASWQPAGVAWRVFALGPPSVTDLSPTRQRWAVRLRADPLLPGAVPLALPAVAVQAGRDRVASEVTPPPVTIAVTASVTLGDKPRPPTDIEMTPGDAGTSLDWRLPLATAAVVAVLVVAVRYPRRKRGAAADSPRARYLRELDGLKSAAAADFSGRLSALVRAYAEAADGLPAPRRTARELAPLTIDTPRLASLADLVRRLDDARFAGVPPSPVERAALLEDASRLA
jgi:hypothetical protein